MCSGVCAHTPTYKTYKYCYYTLVLCTRVPKCRFDEVKMCYLLITPRYKYSCYGMCCGVCAHTPTYKTYKYCYYALVLCTRVPKCRFNEFEKMGG